MKENFDMRDSIELFKMYKKDKEEYEEFMEFFEKEYFPRMTKLVINMINKTKEDMEESE